MSTNLADLKPLVRKKAEDLANLCALKGMPIKITCTYRSPQEQDILYAQGRTSPGPIVTNAKGGYSFHQWRVAFDYVPLDKLGNPDWNGPFGLIGKLGESIGLIWGGDWLSFPDIAHFQYDAGYLISDFRKGLIDERKFELPPDLPPPPPPSLEVSPQREVLTSEETNYFIEVLRWISRQLSKLNS